MASIRAAQFLPGGTVHCFDGRGQKIEEIVEPSVKVFIESNLKRGRISDTTRIYTKTGQIATVAELKKQLKIGGFWASLFGW